jgi:hypothetical protein
VDHGAYHNRAEHRNIQLRRIGERIGLRFISAPPATKNGAGPERPAREADRPNPARGTSSNEEHALMPAVERSVPL